jgi:hypothetical protein
MAKKSTKTIDVEGGVAGPLKVEGDAGKIEMRSAADLIMANNYVQATAAASNPAQGIRFTRLQPDGALNYPYCGPWYGGPWPGGWRGAGY